MSFSGKEKKGRRERKESKKRKENAFKGNYE